MTLNPDVWQRLLLKGPPQPTQPLVHQQAATMYSQVLGAWDPGHREVKVSALQTLPEREGQQKCFLIQAHSGFKSLLVTQVTLICLGLSVLRCTVETCLWR